MKDAAKIYGEALYELARSEELDGQLLPQLRGAAELLTGAPEYQYILSSPAISKAERTGLLDQAFSGQVHPYVLNFMKIIRLTCRTDPDCLGGVRVEMDGQRLDGTVRRHLEDMNDLLSKAVF